MDEMGLDVLLNCILVDQNIRPAMMIQPADYGEATGDDPNTKKILASVHQRFPNLKQSSHYEGYQGIIISHENFDGKVISQREMGRILGYPCYEDFIGETEDIEYSQSLCVNLPGYTKKCLMSNACKNNRHQSFMEQMAKKAQQVLQSYPGFESIQVFVETKVLVSTTMLIDKLLLRTVELNLDDKYSLLNDIANIGSVHNVPLMTRLKSAIQYDNPLHQGILVAILLNVKYNPCVIFYPMQLHEQAKDKMVEVISIGDQLIESVCTVFERKPTDTLIDPLIQDSELNSKDKRMLLNHLINDLINIPVGQEYTEKLQSAIQYHNPMHRGILIGMLLRVKHNPFKPLFTLTMTEEERTFVWDVTNELIKNLLGVIRFTRVKSGGKRSRRRQTRKKSRD